MESSLKDLDDGLAKRERRARRRVFIVLGIIAGAIVLAGLFIVHLAQGALTREITQWRIYMDALVENRQQAIDDWLELELAASRSIAENTAVRLYLSEIEAAPDAPTAQAQKTYLNNLITVTAERLGLSATPGGVRANVQSRTLQGLALLDKEGRTIVSIGRLDPLEGQALNALPLGGVIEGPIDAGGDEAILRVIVPIHAVQADPVSETIVGYIHTARPFKNSLAPLLRQPGRPAADVVTALVGRMDNALKILQSEPAAALPSARLPYSEGLSGFVEVDQGSDEKLLAVFAPINALGLHVMVAVSEQAVLGPVYARRNVMIGGLGLLVVVAVVALLLVWRHGVSRRLARAHAIEQKMVKQLAQARDLLRLVADEQHTAILVFDAQDRIQFANKSVLPLNGHMANGHDDLIGKAATAVFGAALAKPFLQLAKGARHAGRMASASIELDYGRGRRQGRLDAVPFNDAHLGDGAVLLVWDDLTDLIEAREKRERSLEQLLEVLIGLIDARDPYSAAQSRRVAHLSDRVAELLDYSLEERRVTKIAGLVMNLGKILVPKSILTKPEQLEPVEIAQVRAAIAHTSNLLSGVDFDAPVIPILEAAQGDDRDVAKPAALLRVVNAFVGMVSPRAHRTALDVDRALGVLREDATRYDPAAVSALSHIMDNCGGRADVAEWQREGPKSAL